MRIIISVLLLALSFQSFAELPGCDKCVDTQDIAPKAVTTGKIAPNAVTRSKLAPESVGNSELIDGAIDIQNFTPELQQRIQGLVVTDGVGRELPITVTHVTSVSAHGYYTLENNSVIPLVVEAPLYSTEPPQLWLNSGRGSGPWPSSRYAIDSVYYTATGCTGQAFLIGGGGFGGQSVDDHLFEHFFIVDSESPKRSRLIFRIDGAIEGSIVAVSIKGIGGCTETNPQLRISTTEGRAVSQVGTIRWVPPLKITAP